MMDDLAIASLGRIAEGDTDVPLVLPDSTPTLVDFHEPSAVVELLREKGAFPVVDHLADEDYIVGDVHVHRKAGDLLASAQSHHLNDELARLLPTVDKAALIVEYYYGYSAEEQARVEALCRRFNNYLPIIRTKDLNDTVDNLLWVRRLALAGEWFNLTRHPLIFNHGISGLAEYYVRLPGVGVKLALTLAERYPVPIQLDRAVEDTYRYDPKRWKTKKAWREARWDSNLEGMGEGTAKRVEAAILMGDFE